MIDAIPNRPLSTGDILKYAEKLKIPYFRGVFMRDTLPKTGVFINESAVINLDSFRGVGTHWVCYMKRGNIVNYFDSFGNLRPPNELVKYLNSKQRVIINFNYVNKQKLNTSNCGHLCLDFLAV